MQLARKMHDASSDSGTLPPTDDLAEEIRLVEQAMADPSAFAPLYERYAQPVFFFCYRRLNHPEDASDAAAAVFLKALDALPRFRPDPSHPGSTFRSWLYAIARNIVVDLHRRHRNHASLDQGESPLMNSRHLIDRTPSPEDHAIGAEEARLVNAVLQRLPDRQQAVVELRLAGLSIAEISSTLEISESAAKSLQVRAYRTLRELLQTDPHAISRELAP
jgi:RNA polymerase sigma-70 factor (ECF subfamily)